MLNILTSLSFLYAFSIGVLLLYAVLYYRNFLRAKLHRRYFPLVFSLIAIACISFLWINMHPPLRLQTFSNLDHYFIRQDGYLVNRSIELGQGDTANDNTISFNRFQFTREKTALSVSSSYSEEPLYVNGEKGYKLLSVNYPAAGHNVSFHIENIKVFIQAKSEKNFELQIGDSSFSVEGSIKKGTNVWNLFRDDDRFINSVYYNNDKLSASLKNTFLLRDDLLKRSGGELKFFFSGRILNTATKLEYESQSINRESLQFTVQIIDGSLVAWGIGFLDNNRNQFQVQFAGADSFLMRHRYPIAYPLTEESGNDWEPHSVTKFLVAESGDIQHLPATFHEGFLFPSFKGRKNYNFQPVILSYKKAARNEELLLKARLMDHSMKNIAVKEGQLLLPALSGQFNWVFSIRNTYDWQFGDRIINATTWQTLIFASLILFFVLIFCTSLVKRATAQSWVWQLLSCIFLVLMTTRFFLYWRYKSFPPYEGMDLPSQQQLNSFGNFGIILFATVGLGLLLGAGFLRFCYAALKGLFGSNRTSYYKPQVSSLTTLQNNLSKSKAVVFFNTKAGFFSAWLIILAGSGGVAALNGFDPGVCRHLAIALILIYFIFLYFSYQHSPLVKSGISSWWRIETDSVLGLMVSNPVKIILSLSLAGLFVFIDIGFAIVFLNFLLFNEAFLCVNYAMAGLSSGSQQNASRFGVFGILYSVLFILNLLFAPYIFKFLLELPIYLYVTAYLFVAVAISYVIVRLLNHFTKRTRTITGVALAISIFVIAFLFFPKQRILDKAAMTRYRIDVLTTPVDKAIMSAYKEGKTYEPVIRAAQNQWFINTFIDEDNNPSVQSAGFHLLPHAPQNKGAKYNAQATDLVTSRFLVAEHGKWSVLLLLLLILLPSVMLASFYKLYPDFTNRTNEKYPSFTVGFSLLNYLLITALLVILAATGRYIFFGQDLPFGSILSKQSILFPCIILLGVILIFKNAALEQYANRRKSIPGAIAFLLLAVLLFFVKPSFNKNKEFGVAGLATEMDEYVQLQLQPMLDYFDTSFKFRLLPVASKDKLFTDSIRKLVEGGLIEGDNQFFLTEIRNYGRSGYSRHIDQRNMLFLDMNSGHPQLAVNENYFRVEPPPHLQELWTGNVYGDTSNYSVSLWDPATASLTGRDISEFNNENSFTLSKNLVLELRESNGPDNFRSLYLVNTGTNTIRLKKEGEELPLPAAAGLRLANPSRFLIPNNAGGQDRTLSVEPHAFMKNYYVNGSRYYVYPMDSRFNWARNFSEGISSDYTKQGDMKRNAFISLDYELMDSLSGKIATMMRSDTSYHMGAEYGICIADGNGRLIALNDFINGDQRPDPNDKAAFNHLIHGDNGIVSQSQLRKKIGNINLLRMNPGPGSTLKPIVFTAIASQLALDWSSFSVQGFSEKQQMYGGKKVPEYDFEKDNGTINNVVDYLKFSDNYYHSNVLLLGSYPKQNLENLLSKNFIVQNPGTGLHWPYFAYHGSNYWMDGFEHWPGFLNGKANFGSDSSFTSIGLLSNYGIYTQSPENSFANFGTSYDSLLFMDAGKRSGYILPENSVFDQEGKTVNHSNAYDLFTSCFRGHVKGSSQVMIPPAKMLESFGKLTSQNRNYKLTLDPYATAPLFNAFAVDPTIAYNDYLTLVRENVFGGMQAALFAGTAARLGTMLKNGAPYFYYGKTGTTGDDESRNKSKLFAIVISEKDLSAPDYNFRNNKFFTLYFISQKGPAKQNEEFQAAVINYLQQTSVFKRYMGIE